MAVPDPPKGYSPYSEYLTPEKWIQLVTLLLITLFGELAFPGLIGWFIKKIENLQTLIAISTSEMLFIAGVIIIHELIHILMAYYRGLQPKVGIQVASTFWLIKEPHPYVIVLDEFLSRIDNISMLIAPLVLIDLLALIGLLPIFPASVAYYAKIALVFNTAASSSDIYNAIRVWRLPKGTQFINIMDDDIRTFYCEPDSSPSPT
jgi:hypothetical protein